MINFRKIGEGQFERVWRIDQDPRPVDWKGVWGDGSTLWHWYGAKTGLFAIQRTWLGGHEAWYTLDGKEVEWKDYPQFMQATSVEAFENTHPADLFISEVIA